MKSYTVEYTNEKDRKQIAATLAVCAKDAIDKIFFILDNKNLDKSTFKAKLFTK